MNYLNSQAHVSLGHKYIVQWWNHIVHFQYKLHPQLSLDTVCLERSAYKWFTNCIYVNWYIFALPWQIFPSKPVSQIQAPIESSQLPFPEHVPSPGQSNSKQGTIREQSIHNNNYKFKLKVCTYLNNQNHDDQHYMYIVL